MVPTGPHARQIGCCGRGELHLVVQSAAISELEVFAERGIELRKLVFLHAKHEAGCAQLGEVIARRRDHDERAVGTQYSRELCRVARREDTEDHVGPR